MSNETTGRPLGLSIILVALICSNTFGAFTLLTQPEYFLKQFSAMSLPKVHLLVGAAISSVIALLAMWFWKQWGFILIQITFVVVIISDVLFGIYYHIVVASTAYILLMLFAWPARSQFR